MPVYYCLSYLLAIALVQMWDYFNMFLSSHRARQIGRIGFPVKTTALPEDPRRLIGNHRKGIPLSNRSLWIGNPAVVRSVKAVLMKLSIIAHKNRI
jgi:hypothetical protein